MQASPSRTLARWSALHRPSRKGKVGRLAHWLCIVGCIELCALLLAHAAGAEERITDFRSDIDVHQDGNMQVAETIAVNAEGYEINHGIYRDFPTLYRSPAGVNYFVQFHVVSVERDGHSEPYQIERITNGERVRIGSANVVIPHGAHSYRITYDVAGEIGFFASYDELYWNVDGLGWIFPTDKIEAEVTLPTGARILDYTAYTGPQGSTAKDFHAERLADNRISFETTRAMDAHEGLTIVVSWPKGIVAAPTQAQRTGRFFAQNLPIFVSGIGFIVLFIYYTVTWLRVGRDPPVGTIVPLFHPPNDLSPASVRYIHRMAYDRKAFTAALVDMAVKGYLKIRDDGSKFELDKVGDSSKLSSGERRIGDALFAGSSTIKMTDSNHVKFGNAINRLRESLAAENQKTMFVKNQGYFWIGIALTITIAAATAAASPASQEVIGIGLGLAIWIGVVGFSLTRALQRIVSGANSFGDRIGGVFQAVFFLIFAAVFGFASIGIGSQLAHDVGLWPPVLLGATAALNVVFFELLKAPTIAGRKVMDEIEGFRMYLGTAEQHRLDVLTPPKETPELFAQCLPYAIALDVENQWNKRFEKVFEEAARTPGSSGAGAYGYSPAWYSGPRLSHIASGGFAAALGGALATAAASAATAPGSGSGFSGGSSGGGGGGGGGGGW